MMTRVGWILRLGCIASILSLTACSHFRVNSTTKQDAEVAIKRIFFDRNPAAVDQYVSEDYVQHQPGIPNGRAPFKKYLESLFLAFPDYQGEIENIVVENDLVAFHFKWTGTHKGEFMGRKPTGKRISRRTADIVRVKDGKLVEHWGVVDQLSMLLELGLVRDK